MKELSWVNYRALELRIKELKKENAAMKKYIKLSLQQAGFKLDEDILKILGSD